MKRFLYNVSMLLASSLFVIALLSNSSAKAQCTVCPAYDQSIWVTATPSLTGAFSLLSSECRMFEVYMYANVTYTFTTCSNGATFTNDPVMEILNSACTQVAYNDDNCGWGSEIVYTPTTSGTYYLRARGISYSACSMNIAYWRNSGVCIACPSFDFDLYPGTTPQTTGNFALLPDGCRMYRTYMYANTTYNFTVCSNGGSFTDDPVFELLDASCAQVVYSDDVCGVGPQFSYTPTTTGYFYLKARGWSNSACSMNIAYWRDPSVCLVCPAFDFTIAPTFVFQTHSSGVGVGGCKKYEVNLTAGTEYVFTFCDGGGSATYDTYLTLFNPSCLSVATNDDSYCGLPSHLVYTPTVTGTYYLEVNSCCTGNSGGNYTLAYKANCTSSDDCLCATPITALPYNSGVVSNVGATNETLPASGCGTMGSTLWYTITGTGNRMRLSTCDVATNFDTEIRVFTGGCAALTEVACNDDNCVSYGLASTVEFCSTLGVTYQVAVGCFASAGCTGNFVLTVEDLILGTPTPIAGTNSRCVGAGTDTYTSAAANSEFLIWEINPPSAGSIVSNTGVVTWDPLFTGTATISVSGASCGQTSGPVTYNVDVLPLPAAAGAISGPAVVCQEASGESYFIAAVANATSYVWQYSGTGATITGTTESITISFSASATSGTLTVYAQNACGNGVVSANFSIQVNNCTDIEENNNLSFQVLPNPSTGYFNVVYNASTQGMVVFKLYNELSQLVWSSENSFNAGENVISVDLEHLPAGIYYLQSTDETGNQMKKLIIQK